jgi:hypothetical protein
MTFLGQIRQPWAQSYPLDLIGRELVASAVVKLGGARVILPRDCLRVFERAARLDENCGADGLGDDIVRDAWRAQRRRFDLFLRYDAGRRVCRAVVRRVPGGDG